MSLRVLVVDDDDDVREMMTLILAEAGYLVTAVADGIAALRAVEGEAFAVATLDLRMPGLTGRETLAELRAVAPETSVVIVSGHVTPNEAQACIALGAFAILRKPFGLRQLVEMVARAAAATTTRRSSDAAPQCYSL